MTGWHWFGTPEGATALWWESIRAAFAGEPATQAGDIIRAAVEIERAAVVAWLRDQATQARATYDTRADAEIGLTALRVSQTCIRAGEAIERGEHRG